MTSVPNDKTVVPSSCAYVQRVIFSVDQNEGESDKFNYHNGMGKPDKQYSDESG